MHYASGAAPRQPPAVLPKHIKDALAKARVSWLKNTEVAQLLSCHQALGFEVSQEAPDTPPSGSLFLFNRKTLRFFRKDGHSWRKKADGKTVRETHEKLKVGSKDMLNCYYAHSDQQDGLQRRCYWLLSGDDGTVLVHYLASKKIGRAHTAPDVHSEAIDQQIWDTAREVLTPEGLDPHLHTSKDQLGYHSQLQDTCMNFGQDPAMTTAPDLNHTFSAALLPPLPSSSGSKHRRVLLSNPSSAPKQYLDSSFGRPQAIASQTEYALGRADSSLGTPDSAPRHSESIFGKPESAPESVLSRAYLPRRSVMAWPTNAADESASLQGSFLYPEPLASHSRTASAPTIKSDSGVMLSPPFDSPAGMVTPHRRQHSDITNQSYSDPMAEFQLPAQQTRRSMDYARAGLSATALAGQAPGSRLQPNAPIFGAGVYQTRLHGSGSGTGLYQAGLTGEGQEAMQGLHLTPLPMQHQTQVVRAQALSPESSLRGHLSPWESDKPTPMIQDEQRSSSTVYDHSLHHLPMHESLPSQQYHDRYQHTGEVHQETLSSRSSYISHDSLAAQGTLSWPLAYPLQPPQQPPQHPPSQPNLRSLSQLLTWSQAQSHLQSHSQPHSHSQVQSHSQPQVQSQSHSHLQSHSQSQVQSQSQVHAHSGEVQSAHAQSYGISQGQADALEYLRRSTVGISPSWQATPQAADPAAAATAVGQQPTTQSQSEAAFYTWMNARLKEN